MVSPIEILKFFSMIDGSYFCVDTEGQIATFLSLNAFNIVNI